MNLIQYFNSCFGWKVKKKPESRGRSKRKKHLKKKDQPKKNESIIKSQCELTLARKKIESNQPSQIGIYKNIQNIY